MLSYSKIQKKISRVKSKLNKDQRNLHQIDISRNFLLKNFLDSKKQIISFQKMVSKEYLILLI